LNATGLHIFHIHQPEYETYPQSLQSSIINMQIGYLPKRIKWMVDSKNFMANGAESIFDVFVKVLHI